MDKKVEFIDDFPIFKGNKKNPYIILFDAYTGQGKSFVSKIISKYDGSIILNNDEVRYWLNDYSHTNTIRTDLQRYRLELLLKNNNSCIMDSCFNNNWKDKKKYYDSLGYKYYIIRLVCSGETIKKRLDIRIDKYSRGDFNTYLWMKENVSNVDDSLIDYVINTEENVEEQVIDFLDKFNLIDIL